MKYNKYFLTREDGKLKLLMVYTRLEKNGCNYDDIIVDDDDEHTMWISLAIQHHNILNEIMNLIDEDSNEYIRLQYLQKQLKAMTDRKVNDYFYSLLEENYE